jgi:hypothetical protein
MFQFYVAILDISGLQSEINASDPTVYYVEIKSHNLLLKINGYPLTPYNIK